MNRAFTLIELSIVLIIIGLLVGGVLAGRDLIEQAKIRTTAADWREIETVFNTFQLKYDALPGDMDNAYRFWGASCHAIENTCNGTGDGFISGADNEDDMVFNHLSNAGLYEGTYDGSGTIIGEDLPTGPFDGVGYWVAHNTFYGSTNGLHISTASASTPNANAATNSAFSTLNAFTLDQKVDDGVASTGRLLGAGGNANSATDACIAAVSGGTLASPDHTSTPGDVDYDLSESGVLCRVILKID